MINKLDENRTARTIRKTVNKIIDKLSALQVMPGLGYKVKKTALGTVLEIKSGSTAATPSVVQRFKIQSLATNWLVCGKVDVDGNVTESNIKVMKPPATRLIGAVPTGGTTPTSTGDNTRTYNITTTSPAKTIAVVERLFPEYTVGEFLWGISGVEGGTVDDGAGEQVEWIDLNIDARKWTIDLRLIAVCTTGNVTQYAMTRITNPVP